MIQWPNNGYPKNSSVNVSSIFAACPNFRIFGGSFFPIWLTLRFLPIVRILGFSGNHMNISILDGYNFIVSHNKWRNNIVIITSEIRNEHESEKCSFMFLFLMFMRLSWFIKMKSRTKRYKDIKIKIVKLFQIHFLEPVQPTSTVPNSAMKSVYPIGNRKHDFDT